MCDINSLSWLDAPRIRGGIFVSGILWFGLVAAAGATVLSAWFIDLRESPYSIDDAIDFTIVALPVLVVVLPLTMCARAMRGSPRAWAWTRVAGDVIAALLTLVIVGELVVAWTGAS